MKQAFSAAGWKALRGAWVVLALAILASSGIVFASHWYRAQQKRESVGFAGRLQAARARLETARRERDSLRESVDVFRTLVERGLLQNERRLDLVELVNTLRERFQLFSLDYEIAPQRVLPLAAGRTFPAVDVLSSRVKLKARALHEGDILGFMAALAESRQGFYPVDHCVMRRIEAADEALKPHVEAECTLEWITLKEKNANHPG